MKKIINAIQNLLFGDFRLTLTEKQLSNIKSF